MDNPKFILCLSTGVSVLSGIYANVTVPSLVGTQGLLGAAMVGAGTGLTGGVSALAGSVLGVTFGIVAGSPFKSEGLGARIGLAAGLWISGAYGVYKGYEASENMIVNGTQNTASSAVTETWKQIPAKLGPRP